ncbi:unnamed protein product [Brassica rapa]|uniref:Reverse transcriptase zinc-binding domain-containing protein n=1 Tax=Brassica campestris TaxID=3711 RepID=A0A8D9D750_BRACM|nr:unnamed protein product [Brassica rapa]
MRSAVFVLPKAFYAKVDSLCAAFLWKNGTSSARGSRVSWIDICKPKYEGGLGLRQLEEFETVFKLKRTWSFFFEPESLLSRWLKNHIFHRNGFWQIHESPRLSSMVRSMLQLRPMLPDLMRCDIGNGKVASFWFDSWTDIGPLIEIAGDSGPRSLRVRKSAVVLDATSSGSWRLPAARSQQMQTIQIAITAIQPPEASNEPDRFLWRRTPDSFAECVLCSTALETHHHLFFECSFSSAIWQGFASQIRAHPPADLHAAAAWILSSSNRISREEVTLLKLIFQSTIYLVWKERNARIFTSVSTSSSGIHLALDRLLRDRLLSFPASPPAGPSLLSLYFASYRPP